MSIFFVFFSGVGETFGAKERCRIQYGECGNCDFKCCQHHCLSQFSFQNAEALCTPHGCFCTHDCGEGDAPPQN